MLRPIVSHMLLKTPVLPVKCTPARSGCASSGSLTSLGSPGTKLITPGGSPASSNSRIRCHAESIAPAAGFQTTVFPISAALVGRFPAIAVKLNGVTAYTNPSSGR